MDYKANNTEKIDFKHEDQFSINEDSKHEED